MIEENFSSYKNKYFVEKYPSLSCVLYLNSLIYPNNKLFCEFNPKEISLTYKESFSLVAKIACALRDAGIVAGDNVCICAKNSVGFGLSFFAINAASAVIVPIDSLLTAKEVENILACSNSKFAFIDEDKLSAFASIPSSNVVILDREEDLVTDQVRYSCLKTFISAYANVEIKILDKDEQEAQAQAQLEAQVQSQADSHFSKSSDLSSSIPSLALPLKSSDLACILFTSGTTGIPKGVMLSGLNLLSDTDMTVQRFNVFPTDVVYSVLPLHHSYALQATFLTLVVVGASIVFGKRLVSSFILKDLRRGGVTIFVAVPLIFVKLIQGIFAKVKKRGFITYTIFKILMSRSYKMRFNKGKNVGRKYFSKILSQISFDNIRCCITGGGPIAPEIVKDYLCLGVEFMQGYGMTETSPILTLNPLGSNNIRSVGKVLDGITAEIRDKDESGSGVLCVKGPNNMFGYYNNPEATKEIIMPDGFLVTGDVGIIDEDGYFYITGRAKNIIVTSGGKNVFPEEIEEEFSSSKLIEQIVVVGYKKEGLDGEAVRALCYPSKYLRDKYKDKWGGMKKEIEKEVLSVNKRLRSYKKIESVLVVKEPFETTTTKKIKRKGLDEKIKNAI